MLRITRLPLTLALVALPLGARAAHTLATDRAPAVVAARSSSPSAGEIARHVDGYYSQVASFKASFKQRYDAPAYNRRKDSAGSVIFEKPGKMSWRYTSNGNRVVCDGKVIKIYEKDAKQMYEQPLSKTQYPAALSFLTGQANSLLSTFRLRKLDAKQMIPSGYVLEGVPLQPTPAYERVFFYIDAQSFQVHRVLLLDSSGNRNRFDFSAVAPNVKVPAGEFSFAPPPSTLVIWPGGVTIQPAASPRSANSLTPPTP